MRAPAEVVIGQVVGVTATGAPLVTFASHPGPEPVATMATASYDDAIGRSVALMFLNGDPARPLALGLITPAAETSSGVEAGAPLGHEPVERLTLSATREIVLECGRASLVLTRAGKVLLRGAYLSLRSSGMNRITGASVQIN
jgi:hypothetical protein